MQVNRCYNCMAELHSAVVCPLCGYDMSAMQKLPYALAPGTVLHGKYLMGRMLGQGGFGITYVGFDLALEIKVAIKECYISHQCVRNTATSTEVLWVSRDKGAEDYRNVFLREARKMAKIRDIPYLTRVLDIFHENETAYIVMDFVEGETLAARIQRQDAPLAWDEALPIFQRVLQAMELVHQRGMIHRDLSPDNLMLEPDGSVRILDLGAAKDLNQGSGASSMVVAKNGFTPLEQYGQRGGSNASSDVYALAATMFFSLTKTLPPSPIDRLQEDRLELSLLRERRVPEYAVNAIAAALALWQRERTPTMAAFAAQLTPAAEEPPLMPVNGMRKPAGAERAVPETGTAEASGEDTSIAAEAKQSIAVDETASHPQQTDPAPEVQTSRSKSRQRISWKRLLACCILILLLSLGASLPIVQQLLHPARLTYTLREDGCAVITGCEGSAGNLQIPSTLNGYYVAAIGEGAFTNRTDLKSITISEGVDEIHAKAFLNCTSLTSVKLPSNLQIVGDWAFAGCSSVAEVSLSENLIAMGRYSFYGCTSLTAISLPETLQDLGIGAFSNCTALTAVTLPNSLAEIRDGTFSGCTSLSSVVFPAELESIGSNAFQGCALTQVELPQKCDHSSNSFDAGVEIHYRNAETAAAEPRPSVG